MKRNFSFLDFLIIIILLLSYIYSTRLLPISQTNAFSALIILSVFVLWSIRLNKSVPTKYIAVTMFIILVIILTQQLNLISLVLLLIFGMMSRDQNQSYKGKDIHRDPIKLYLKFNIIMYIFVVLLYFSVGFNGDVNYNMWRIDGTIFREGIGFSHPNQAMIIWLGCALGILSFATKKNWVKILLFTLIPTYFIFNYTQSRTASLVIYALCIAILIFRKSLEKPLTKKGRNLLSMFPLVCGLVSYSLIFLPFNYELDRLLSGRIVLYKSYYQQSGFTLFGFSFLEDAMIDNAYIQSLLSKGLVFSLLFLIIFSIIIRKNKNLSRIDSIIIIGFFSAGLAETMLFKLEILILIMLIMFRNEKIISFKPNKKSASLKILNITEL